MEETDGLGGGKIDKDDGLKWGKWKREGYGGYMALLVNKSAKKTSGQ
jgi:hypothetical protein